MIVLDCCAALAIAKDTEEGRALAGLRLVEEHVVAPSVLEAELCNALWKEIRGKTLGKELAMDKLEESLGLVDEIIPIRSLMREVVSESVRLGHPVYDIFYFVLARRLGATLFTLDKRLIKLCEQEGVDCIHNESL